MAAADSDVRMLESCSSQAETATWVKHAHMSQLLKQTGCHTSPASVHELRPFAFLSLSLSLSLHHMCEFYRNGWGFQRSLDLSNKPQQAVNPASQPPTETGTVSGEVRVGIGI